MTIEINQENAVTRALTRTEHHIDIDCDASEVFELLADVSNWPRIFPPTVHAETTPTGPGTEDIHIWATANGSVKNWISERTLDPEGLRITFRQKRSQPPVASMGGTWDIEPLGPGRCHVRLGHDFTAVDDLADNVDWIQRAIDTNSNAELAALKANAEAGTPDTGLLFEFEDAVEVDGPAAACFDFVNEANLWDRRLDHVAQVRLDEDEQGVQTLEMDTIANDGSTHTTKSFRICFGPDSIVYKQTTLPPLMTVHNGQWRFVVEENGSATVSSRHVVLLNPEKITTILGPDADVDTARNYVQKALSTNSLLTLNRAKAFAEGAQNG